LLPPKVLLSYYVRAMKSTLVLISVLGTLFFAAWWISGADVGRVFQIVQLQEAPEKISEWIIFLSTALLKFAPVFGFVEIKTLSEEEKMELKASAMEDHIILVGLGHLGRRVADLLQKRGKEFVVIVLPRDKERNECLDELKAKGIPVIFGDASLSRTLKRANVKKAKALLITIDDDLINSVIAERAKELNPSIRIVARVFREELAKMLRSSGDVDVAISTTLASSQLFLAGALYDVVISVPPLAPVRVEKGSEMEGKNVGELEEMGVYVIGVLVGDKWIAPPKDRIIKQGDVILVQL